MSKPGRPCKPSRLAIRRVIANHPDDTLTSRQVATEAMLDPGVQADLTRLGEEYLCTLARQELKRSGADEAEDREQYVIPLGFEKRRLPRRVSVPPEDRPDLETDDDPSVAFKPLFRCTPKDLRLHVRLLLNNEQAVVRCRIVIEELLAFVESMRIPDDTPIGDVLRGGAGRAA